MGFFSRRRTSSLPPLFEPVKGGETIKFDDEEDVY